MAASSTSALDNSQFQCSICLDAFVDPVSIPCGHNFCKHCIGKYWDSRVVCECPICKEIFYRRPELRINTAYRDIVDHFKNMTINKERAAATPGEVSCDVCIGMKLKALKSCLVCLTSYCETHLEPHQRLANLKIHKLIDPVDNLEDRMCQKHQRLLELFCEDEEMCLCQVCAETEHKLHNTVTVEREAEVRKAQIKATEAEVQQMIQGGMKKVREIKRSVELSIRSAEKEVEDIIQVFNTLIMSIKKTQAELVNVVNERQKAEEEKAEGLMKELEEEITELQRRSAELEQLSHTEDHVHLLQRYSEIGSVPEARSWPKVSGDKNIHLCMVGRRIYTIQESLIEEVKRISRSELMQMQQYAVELSFDHYTAGPWVIISPDGKQVKKSPKKRKNVPDNAARFTNDVCVLANESFTSGKYYWEVGVKDKSNWFLGVAKQSVNRKEAITVSPSRGFWAISNNEGKEIEACTDASVSLPLDASLKEVGVFVDYEGGRVSFYNVEGKSHIFSFNGCLFKEKIFPIFAPCQSHADKKECVPLTLSPMRVSKRKSMVYGSKHDLSFA